MKTANFSYPNSGLKIPFAYDGATASLPAYGGKASGLLNPVFEFLNDGSYVLGIRAIPTGFQQNASNLIQPNQSFEDNINVPEGSFLTMIGAVGDDGTSNNGVQRHGPFRVRIFDVGSQSYLSDDFVHQNNIGGWIASSHAVDPPYQPFEFMQLAANRLDEAGSNQTKFHGLFILPSPMVISSPGQLTVQIVNLDSLAITVDMAFYFAIPIGGHTPISPASVSGNFTRSSIR